MYGEKKKGRTIVMILGCSASVLGILGVGLWRDDIARWYHLYCLRNTPHVDTLNRLLQLNDDSTTDIGMLGHPTRAAGIDKVATITSAGRSYVAVVARRFPSERPQGDGLGVVFIFEESGRLLARFGGQCGKGGRNGDDVKVVNLGSEDQWFVWVSRFEKHKSFEHRAEIYLVEPGFCLAFRLWGFPNAMAWTEQPKTHMRFPSFFNPGGLSWGARGQGKDGREHELLIGWDVQHRIFRGPCQVENNGEPVYQIDLKNSLRFQPTDLSQN